MESKEQVRSGGGVPPGRPPPPHYPSAPPPYYDPVGPVPPPGAPAPGGAYYPPPPAYTETYPVGYPPGYQEAYQPGYPPPAPPMYPGGHSMYPDVTQLPQPEAGNVSFAGVVYGDPYSSTVPHQHGGQPYLNNVPHHNGLHGGQPYPNTVPYQHGLHGGQPYQSTVPDQHGLHGSQPYPSTVPDQHDLHGGQPYPSTVPYQHDLHGGQPYPSTVPYQHDLYGGQPYPSTVPHQHGLDGGQPYPTTGQHQYGLLGGVLGCGLEASQGARADTKCRVGPGYGGVPMYGSEAPPALPSSPCEPPPPYDDSSISQTSASATHASQAYPTKRSHAYPHGAPASTDTAHPATPLPLGFMYGSGGSTGVPAPGTPSASPPMPVRPAPAPPHQSPWTQNLDGPSPPITSSAIPQQHPSSTPLKDGQPPSGCVVTWRGGDGLEVFFLQSEGHIVSPRKPLMMSVYKRIGGSPCEGEENLLGMVEVPGCWRLKLTGKTPFALHTSGNSYIFLDDSTCPKRIVVLQLPDNVSKTMQTDLLAVINELTDLREEQEGIAEKITTGFGTAYTDLTKKLNTVVKETVPGAHKSTKWLRKSTGSLARMGGSAVSKGIHLIADHIPANEQPKEESPVHTELLAALKQFKKSKEEGSITYV